MVEMVSACHLATATEVMVGQCLGITAMVEMVSACHLATAMETTV